PAAGQARPRPARAGPAGGAAGQPAAAPDRQRQRRAGKPPVSLGSRRPAAAGAARRPGPARQRRGVDSLVLIAFQTRTRPPSPFPGGKGGGKRSGSPSTSWGRGSGGEVLLPRLAGDIREVGRMIPFAPGLVAALTLGLPQPSPADAEEP